jgi:hypothetical protein
LIKKVSCSISFLENGNQVRRNWQLGRNWLSNPLSKKYNAEIKAKSLRQYYFAIVIQMGCSDSEQSFFIAEIRKFSTLDQKLSIISSIGFASGKKDNKRIKIPSTTASGQEAPHVSIIWTGVFSGK